MTTETIMYNEQEISSVATMPSGISLWGFLVYEKKLLAVSSHIDKNLFHLTINMILKKMQLSKAVTGCIRIQRDNIYRSPPQQHWQLNQNQCMKRKLLQTQQAYHRPQRENTCIQTVKEKSYMVSKWKQKIGNRLHHYPVESWYPSQPVLKPR